MSSIYNLDGSSPSFPYNDQLRTFSNNTNCHTGASSEEGGRGASAHASRHQAAEQRRRNRINERLDLLRSMVPHSERSNTAVFLEEVILYIGHLKSRTAEAEATLSSLQGGGPSSVPRSHPSGAGGPETSSISRAPTGPPSLSAADMTGMLSPAAVTAAASASAISLSPAGGGLLSDFAPSQGRPVKVEPLEMAMALNPGRGRQNNEMPQIQQQIQDQLEMQQQQILMNQQQLMAMNPMLPGGGGGSGVMTPVIDPSLPQSALLLQQQLQMQIQQQQHHEAALAELRKQQRATAEAVAAQQMLWLQQQQQSQHQHRQQHQHQAAAVVPSAPAPSRQGAEDDLANRLGLKMVNVNVSVGGGASGDTKASSKTTQHVTKSAPRPPTPNLTPNMFMATPMLFQQMSQQQLLAQQQQQQQQQQLYQHQEDLQALLCMQQQQLQQQHQQLQQKRQQQSEAISDAARSLASLSQDPNGNPNASSLVQTEAETLNSGAMGTALGISAMTPAASTLAASDAEALSYQYAHKQLHDMMQLQAQQQQQLQEAQGWQKMASGRFPTLSSSPANSQDSGSLKKRRGNSPTELGGGTR